MTQALTFPFRGNTITIDLSLYGSAGATIDATARADAAGDLLNQLAYLKAEWAIDHLRVKGQIMLQAEQAFAAANKKWSKTAGEEWMKQQPAYQESRKVRDFIDSAFDIMKSIHCPRMRMREHEVIRVASQSRASSSVVPDPSAAMSSIPSSEPHVAASPPPPGPPPPVPTDRLGPPPVA